MARPRSKARAIRTGKNKNSLKQREHRDQQGGVQLHTTKYEDREASQSGEPQKRPRSPSASSKRPSEQSDQSSNPLNQPKSSVAQPGSGGRSTRHGRNSVDSGEVSLCREPQKPARSSSTSSKTGSDESDQASNFGNLAQSILDDRPGLLLAAAAAAGTFLISRWLGENGWLRRSFGRVGDGENFIFGGSRGQGQVPPNRNEANTVEPAQHTGIDGGDVDSEASFEVAQASQEDAVAQ